MPAINVLFFGNLAEISGSGKLQVELGQKFNNTDDVKRYLYGKFPGLERAKFIMAVNHEIVTRQTLLVHGDEVALLPPFAGG